MNRRDLHAHATALGFAPRDAVRWLSPGQLAQTGAKVALSAVFADYSDKREIQAALGSGLLTAPAREPGVDEDVWLDFVADLGDGFDATYTIATHLAAARLEVSSADGAGATLDLPRGSLLVMGGDEVYPTASARAYEDRTLGPYRAALPTADDPPLLVALPGNHDWYDGLTAFLRIFTQGRPVGGWRTEQHRSYFAVKLPRHWWLVALDSQFGTYIDQPQLEYFEEHVTQHLEPGDAVIICSATPTWVHSAVDHPDAFDSLHWFDRNYLSRRQVGDSGEMEDTGATVRLWVTGDSHHYARYAERFADETGVDPDDHRRRQMVTCGLGGAYLSATHSLPAELAIPPASSRVRDKGVPPATFVRGVTSYPSAADSRSLSRRLALPWLPQWLPRRNPGFPELAAGLHVVGFFVVSFIFGLTVGRRPVPAVREASLAELGSFAWKVLVGVAVVIALLWLAKARRVRDLRRPPSTLGLAFLFQVGCALVILLVAMAIPWSAGWSDWVVLLCCLALAAVVGASLGSEAFALNILLAPPGKVADWQMAGQAEEDHKGFLRMTITAGGDLVIYPVIIDRVCHDWRVDDDTDGVTRPHPADPLATPRLAEPSVTITREGRHP